MSDVKQIRQFFRSGGVKSNGFYSSLNTFKADVLFEIKVIIN